MTPKKMNLGLFILRLGLGIMFIIHGYPKISGGVPAWTEIGQVMGSVGLSFAPAFWGFMAALSEFGGGILLISGLLFTPACALMFFTMAMATHTHVTNGDAFGVISHPLTLAFVFLGLLFVGPGEWALTPRRSGRIDKSVPQGDQSGKVKRILRNKGFGFITDADGKQIFFHQTAVVKGRFEQLREGQPVKFAIKQTPKGPNAVNIRVE